MIAILTRSIKQRQTAVERHMKRNHSHHCPICLQSFKNCPDNVKPHVARKHPQLLSTLYS